VSVLERRLDDELRGWAGLSIAALALAGLLALVLALSRTPGVQDVMPVGTFQRALVTHVVFSFVVWYLGVLGTLSTWAAAGLAEDGVPLRLEAVGPLGLRGAWASYVLLLLPVALAWGEPTLNDYVPTVTHPAFYTGLALLLLSVAMPVVRLMISLPKGAEATAYGTAAAGLAYLVALSCFLLAWLELPAGAEAEARNQILFWGGGHVLQFVNTMLMLVVWQALGERLHLVPPLPQAWFRGLLGLTATVTLAGPVFYWAWPADGGRLIDAFTKLYWFGLVVQPTVVGGALAWLMVRRGPRLGEPAGLALVLSLVAFAVGGVMGYFLGAGDTRVPAHYHAVIGGTTLAFMAFFVTELLPRVERPVRGRRVVVVFLGLYGVGQLLHSVGLWVAGGQGVARKTAGAAQQLSGGVETAAMVVMGIGGVVAVIGGVLFVVVVGRRLLAGRGV